MQVFYKTEDENIRSQRYCCLSFIDKPSKEWQKMDQQVYNFILEELQSLPCVNKTPTFKKVQEMREDFYTDNYDQIIEALPSHLKNKVFTKSLKIRGAYETREEAENKILKLQRKMKDTEPIHIYISDTGKWTPFMFNDMPEDTNYRLNHTLYSFNEYSKELKFDFEERMKNVEKEKLVLSGKNTENEVDYSSNTYSKNLFDETVDYLDEDPEILRKYFCVSFSDLSKEAEKVIIKLTVKEFVKYYLQKEEKEYYKNDLQRTLMEYNYDKFEKFLTENKLTFVDDFNIPCFKLRGVFKNVAEAEKYSKSLQESNSNIDTFIGTVGVWLPFAPMKEKLKINYADKRLQDIYDSREENRKKTELSKKAFTSMGYKTQEAEKYF